MSDSSAESINCTPPDIREAANETYEALLPQKSKELQVILFLQSCYFSIETAKATIDIFYTVKTHCPEFFTNRDPNTSAAKEFMNLGVHALLPKPTQQNYRVIFCKIVDPDSSRFIFSDQIKNFDMNVMLWLMQEGTAEGLLIVLDMEVLTFGHMTKLGVMTMKKLFYYLQMHLHTESIESLYKFVPKECLPKDFGGTVDSISDLHASMKKRLQENADYFKAEEKFVVDETRRPGKPKNVGDIFGVEGTFKKLDID